MNILLIVGNGLTIDFNHKVLKANPRFDTRSPLSWNFSIPAAGNRPALEALAELGSGIQYVRSKWPNLANDFDIIEKLGDINQTSADFNPLVELVKATAGQWVGHLDSPYYFANRQLDAIGTILRLQLRLFLNEGFAAFHDFSMTADPSEWSWAKWFERYAKSIGMLISFNYDLIAEGTLSFAGHDSLSHLISDSFPQGLTPVFKPHGSINYENTGIKVDNIYNSGGIFERLDTPVIIVNDDKLHEARLIPDIVLPKEYSEICDFQHVACGYRYIQRTGGAFTHCVIVGVSYWEHDRPEIDSILATLAERTSIILVDPAPSSKFIDFLKIRFSSVRIEATSPPLDL